MNTVRRVIGDHAMPTSSMSIRTGVHDIPGCSAAPFTELMGADQDAVRTAYVAEMPPRKVQALVIALGCDEYSEDDVEQIYTGWPGRVIEAVSSYVLTLSGLNDDVVDDAEGNSGGDRISGSVSGSP